MKKQFGQAVLSLAIVVGLFVSLNTNAETIPLDQKVLTQSERDKQAAEEHLQVMTNASLQVLSLIDQGKGSGIWDGLSPTVRPLVSLDSFIQRIRVDQSNFGAPLKRERVAAYPSEADGQNGTPKGVYYSVVFMTNFAKGQGRELMSFRLDDDKIWRVAGYSLTRAESK